MDPIINNNFTTTFMNLNQSLSPSSYYHYTSSPHYDYNNNHKHYLHDHHHHHYQQQHNNHLVHDLQSQQQQRQSDSNIISVNSENVINSLKNLFNELHNINLTVNMMNNGNGVGVGGGNDMFINTNMNNNNYNNQHHHQNNENNNNETLSSLLLSSSIQNNDSDHNGYIPYESRPETYIVPIIFLFIFVIGTIGNGTVIYIFYQHKSMRTVANVYILSLAIGDLAMILITVPFVSTIYTFESWPYGLAVCKISEFARDLSIGVTVFTLTSLSVQRYTATHHPIRYLSHKGRTTLTQANTFIWFLATILAIPGAYYSFIMKVAVNDNHTINVCYPFPSQLGDWYPKTIVMIKFLSYYAIPLIIITIFYSLMARSLIRTTENPVCNNDSHNKLLKNRRKISRIVLGLVVIFAICFFPNQVFMLWYHFNANSNENYNTFWHIWRIIGFVLSFLNSCLNPIVLCCISGVFRSHFKRYIFACCYSNVQRSRETSITPGFRSINSIDLNTKDSQSGQILTKTTSL
ncbi:neuropeptide CCHamide-1 receptor-like isoform X2 [Dermatophagoides pteronyssinus]|uniref:neuropeptide CCHamide-1 receptor-like isoform X2 n=1 Tax=Dermatophagoides pteronyssinus TaxID=6956 RepID=UPI003F663883